MKKLFVSVSGTIKAVELGWVTLKDLEEGLFFLIGVGGRSIEARTRAQLNPAEWLKLAMTKAIAEGRGRWIGDTKGGPNLQGETASNPWTMLNELLSRNGYTQIDESPDSSIWTYVQQAVLERVKELEVVTNKYKEGEIG